MKTLDLKQGSGEWLAHRAACLNASDAPAMMGVSTYRIRSDLIRQKATGIEPEYDQATLARFRAGHDAEAAMRPEAERIIGEELYPVVGEHEIDGLRLSASSDGLTLDGLTGFEHKLWNETLADSVRDGIVPESHIWQVIQQHAVFGLERTLFMVSDGTPDRMVWCWVAVTDVEKARLISAWKQFQSDVANWQPTKEDTGAPIVADPETLPALTVRIVGQVVDSNLTAWKNTILTRIQAISTDLRTDEDFAVAEKTVKFLGEGEKRLELVKSQAQAQASDIDTLFRAIDQLREEMRVKRLSLDKLVQARKDTIRVEIVQYGQRALDAHVATLNQRIGKDWMPRSYQDFAGAIKGRKTVASLREAVDTELARAKIAASEAADRIEINLRTLRELAAGNETLFADARSLCVNKAPEDLVATIKSRLADHQAEQAKRLEAERERIRAEEQAKAEREARAAADAMHSAARLAEERERIRLEEATHEEPSAADTPMAPVASTQPAAEARLKLGELNAILAPLSLTADGLAQLGFMPVGTDKAAKFYREDEVPEICMAIVARMNAVAMEFKKNSGIVPHEERISK